MPDFRTPLTVKTWIVISQVLNIMAVVLIVILTSNARDHNCTQLSKAFDAYTVGLVGATAPPDGRTPEQQADLEERVQLLHDIYDPILADCR